MYVYNYIRKEGALIMSKEKVTIWDLIKENNIEFNEYGFFQNLDKI